MLVMRLMLLIMPGHLTATLPLVKRANLLKKWYALILEHKQELATLMTMECGKVLQESLGEVDYGASFVEWFAEEAKRTYGDVIPSQAKDKRIIVIKQSIGVVAALTPWNFPLAMITRKVGPALAAGSPVVVKPPSETPLTALRWPTLPRRPVSSRRVQYGYHKKQQRSRQRALREQKGSQAFFYRFNQCWQNFDAAVGFNFKKAFS